MAKIWVKTHLETGCVNATRAQLFETIVGHANHKKVRQGDWNETVFQFMFVFESVNVCVCVLCVCVTVCVCDYVCVSKWKKDALAIKWEVQKRMTTTSLQNNGQTLDNIGRKTLRVLMMISLLLWWQKSWSQT